MHLRPQVCARLPPAWLCCDGARLLVCWRGAAERLSIHTSHNPNLSRLPSVPSAPFAQLFMDIIKTGHFNFSVEVQHDGSGELHAAAWMWAAAGCMCHVGAWSRSRQCCASPHVCPCASHAMPCRAYCLASPCHAMPRMPHVRHVAQCMTHATLPTPWTPQAGLMARKRGTTSLLGCTACMWGSWTVSRCASMDYGVVLCTG